MNTADSFDSAEGALLRARLHIRAGKRRLRQGKISSGIVTLYDAMLFAFQWYVSSEKRRQGLSVAHDENLRDEHRAYAAFRRAGILNSDFDYRAFNLLVERALDEEIAAYDYTEMLGSFESAMTQLGVMPFDESALPPEDPSTF
jgi:hypothetical protein